MRAVELTLIVDDAAEVQVSINPAHMIAWASMLTGGLSRLQTAGAVADDVEESMMKIAETPDEITRRWEAAMNDAMGGEPDATEQG